MKNVIVKYKTENRSKILNNIFNAFFGAPIEEYSSVDEIRFCHIEDDKAERFGKVLWEGIGGEDSWLISVKLEDEKPAPVAQL